MDAYGDSLRHVNQLYNRVFGSKARKVPAHMSHFIDVDIVKRMQTAFQPEFQVTSGNKIRSATDMQFAFSYFYFLTSETRGSNLSSILQGFDTDHTGYEEDCLDCTGESEERMTDRLLHFLSLFFSCLFYSSPSSSQGL